MRKKLMKTIEIGVMAALSLGFGDAGPCAAACASYGLMRATQAVR